MNGALYFGAIDNTLNPALFKTDGTTAGTTLITYVPIAQMLNVNNTLIFSGNNDPAQTLMKSNGTAAGTVQLKTGGGPIGALTNSNGIVYYYASLASSVNIWKSDGTVSGTVIVKNIPSTGAFPVSWFCVSANTVFFVSPTPATGFELWKTDGTLAGTVVVKDITPGTQSSGVANPVNINNTLYFSANDGVLGNELWKSDGTEAGTVLVQDINTAGTSNPSSIFQIGSKLYIAAQDGINGRELWAADLGSPGPLPLTLLDVNAKLVGQNGVVSWKTTFEENTSHFEIERSTNNRQYNKVGTVASANTGGTHDYSYTDPQITTLGVPVVFYRLKMKDRDSRSTYSKTFAIDISSDQPVVMLYPTPVRESATVMIAVKRKENLTLSVVDINGKMVQQKKIVVNEGSNLVSIETDKLSAGTYTVMISGESTNTSTRLVKQ
jgi:ELWxxDGT repeat protein